MNVGFIYNPESGNGRIEHMSSYIEEAFLKHGHTVTKLKTTKHGDAKSFGHIFGSKYDILLVAGGDGTLNEVVNGIMQLEKRPKIAYIPTGTVNDVAHLIGIPRSIRRAVKMILDKGVYRKMDVSKINDTYFTYAAATGKFAVASYDLKRSDKKRFGILAYVFRGISDLFNDYKMPAVITYDDGRLEGTYTLMLFLNGARVAGFNLFLIKKSKVNDGFIEARIFERRRYKTLFRILSFFALGGLVFKGVHQLKSKKYEVDFASDVDWNTDGEKTEKNSVKIEVIQEAIEILVSKKASKWIFKNA